MSDFWMLFIFGTLCIFIAYGMGCQIGYKRGVIDGKYRAIMQYIEMKAKLQTRKMSMVKLTNFSYDFDLGREKR